MSDAMEGLRVAAEDGRARRRQTRLVVVALLVLMTVNLASVLGVGILFLHDRQRLSRERRNSAAGSKIVSDLYASANDTNAVVHRLEGTPAPAPAVPPVPATTTTTSRSRARSAGRTASTAPPGTNRPSTTEIGQPPPSEPSHPPIPAPSPPTTTTTTTRPCTTVPLLETRVC